MYNVLWIDDQYEKLLPFAIEAENEGLLLKGYKSWEEGERVLEAKLNHFDLILLDGLFYEKKGQVEGTEDESGIGAAIAKINELKSRKVFPWFVFSGKDKFTKGENTLLKANKVNCYDKKNPDDVRKLFDDMISAAEAQPDIQLKYKYAKLLEICSDDLIGDGIYPRLINLIKDIENTDRIQKCEDKLTSIRKIVEGLFTTLGKYKIIPQEMVGAKGWINGSSLFLSKKHDSYDFKSDIIPPLVAFNIHKLLDIIQDGSHAYGDLKYKVDKYIKDSQSDYFFRSSVFLLFDLLLWFKDFIIDNSDKSINESKWETIANPSIAPGNLIQGKVIKIAENGYGTFQPDNGNQVITITPTMVLRYQLKDGDNISVTTKPSPDGTKIHIDEIRVNS